LILFCDADRLGKISQILAVFIISLEVYMNFGIDSIIKTFDKAFHLKKNVIALLHLITAFLVLFLLTLIGGKIGGGAAFVFSFIGILLFYYVLIRNFYFLSYFALDDLKSAKAPNYAEARTAFNSQKWAAVFVPVVFALAVVAIALVEVLLQWILMQIPTAGSIIQALIMLPLFIVNFFIFMVLFFGSTLIYPIMIDQKKGILETIKAVFLTIKKRFQSILIYNMLSAFLMVMLFLITFFLTGFALFSSGGVLMQGLFTSFFSKYGAFAPRMDAVTMIILGFNIAVILAFLMSYISNVKAGIQASIYLAVKEGIDYNEKISFDFNKIKATMKDSLK